MSMSRIVLATAFVAGLVPASTVPAAAQDLDTMSVAELLPLAREEGQVTVYAFTSRIARVETAFEAAYPGIDLLGRDITSTEQIARLRREAAAGTVQADVVYISDAPVVLTELLAEGIIAPYVPPRIIDRVPAVFRSPLLAQRLSTKVLMYNEEANPDGAPIDNLWQLTTPEWAGRVVMVDPLLRGDYLDLMTAFVLNADAMATAYELQFDAPIDLGGARDAGERFIMDLFANNLILVPSTDQVNAAVGRIGQDNPPVGFTSYSDRRDNAEEGWALQIAATVIPATGITFPAVLALTEGAENPAAARIVIDFLMGDDSDTGGPGYAPFYVAGDYSTRIDIAPHPDAIPLVDLRAWRVIPAATAGRRDRVADLIMTLR